MSILSDKKREKRRIILTEAYELFSKYDYKNVSLSDIAKNSGMHKSLLQKYYAQKKDIVKNLLEDMLFISFRYMDEQYEKESMPDKLAEYTFLLFSATEKNQKLNRFVKSTISETELMDIWIELVFDWLKRIGELEEIEIPEIRLKAALSFAMYGSLHLYLKREEFEITTEYICEHLIHAVMTIMQEDPERIEEVLDGTKKKMQTFDRESFYQYCTEQIHWLSV